MPPAPGVTATSSVLKVRQAVARFLSRDEPVFFDIETTGLDPRANKLVMVQLFQASGRAPLIIDWRRIGEDRGHEDAVCSMLSELFKARMAVGHNLKFDSEFLLARGVRLPRVFDTMLAEQLMGFDDVTLAGTLRRRFRTEMDKAQRTWFYQPLPLDERPSEWRAPFPQEELDYAALDVTELPALYELQRRELKRLGLRGVAHIEMRALPAIAAMELRGIRVEPTGWRAFIEGQANVAREAADTALNVLGPHILAERIDAYDAALAEWEQYKADQEAEVKRLRTVFDEPLGTSKNEYQPPKWGDFKQAGLVVWKANHPAVAKPKLELDPPNIGSQKQLIVAMKALDIPVPTKKNEQGETKETTDSDNLERLAPQYPVIRDVLDSRRAQKFVDAFGEKLLAFADADSRIHPDYHQIGADTGRMSCSKPNWQQVPARGDGAALRKCVIAAEGHKLIIADFSNIELRIIADLSGDERMLAMFASGEDLHSYTARLMFDLDRAVDPKHTDWRGGLTYRQAAKIVNYLIPYGGSAYAIAMQNNMPVKDAEELVTKWFGMFAGVGLWMEGLKAEVHQTLKSVTLSGRTRTYNRPEEPRLDPGKKRDAAYFDRQREYKKQWASIERQARNSPVQGLSADITKLAVARFYETCPAALGGLVAVVHDELVAEAPEPRARRVAQLMATAMDEAAHHFLKRVALPFPQPTISDHWEHD